MSLWRPGRRNKLGWLSLPPPPSSLQTFRRGWWRGFWDWREKTHLWLVLSSWVEPPQPTSTASFLIGIQFCKNKEKLPRWDGDRTIGCRNTTSLLFRPCWGNYSDRRGRRSYFGGFATGLGVRDQNGACDRCGWETYGLCYFGQR